VFRLLKACCANRRMFDFLPSTNASISPFDITDFSVTLDEDLKVRGMKTLNVCLRTLGQSLEYLRPERV
jgi:hypothetical protein